MTAERKINEHRFTLSERRLTVITFALFFAWLLAIPFEGRILHALLGSYQIAAQPYILGAICAHCVGFILCGLFVRDMRRAKRLVLFSILFCIAASGAFFFPPSFWWHTALFSSSFLTGCCMAAWGFFLKSGIQKSERVKTIADVIVFSYILTTSS